MLIIRAEQKKALSAAIRVGFEERMCAYLKDVFPRELSAIFSGPPASIPLRDFVRHGIDRAATFGVEAERDVARFIELMVRVEPKFESQREMAWAVSILRDKTLSPHARIELVHAMLPRKMPALAAARGGASSA